MDVFTLSGFAVGLVGSLHCLGMCGPIVLALPGGDPRSLRHLTGRLLYNLGRTVTYATMGIVCGFIGKTIAMAGFQQTMSVVAGVLILAYVVVPASVLSRITPRFGAEIVARMSSRWSLLFSSTSIGALIGIGLLNGLLPCGLVYVALGASAATGSPVDAAIYMTLFGLGTLPLMFVASVAGSFITVSIRRKITRLLPVGALLLASLLILRGLSLNIPYISPVLDPIASDADSCCH